MSILNNIQIKKTLFNNELKQNFYKILNYI